MSDSNNPSVTKDDQNQALQESAFLKACRKEDVDYTPVWLMRQAGRYMSDFQKIRAKVSLLELCKNPQLAAEVTIMAVDKLQVDAAIIFADILLPLDAMGVGLSYVKGAGPQIEKPVRSPEDLQNLKPIFAAVDLDYVLQAIKITRQSLSNKIPLIGFAGAPFTLASYLIEGGPSKQFERTKMFMYNHPQAWHTLLNTIAEMTNAYLMAQIDAGAQAVQLFDSWAGCLSPADYQKYVLTYTKQSIAGINEIAPVIHFGVGCSGLLELMNEVDCSVMGIDWRITLDEAWARLDYRVGLQGNLDPTILLADYPEIKKQAKRILEESRKMPGHIFNLGHGVLPETNFDKAKYLVDVVHELGMH